MLALLTAGGGCTSQVGTLAIDVIRSAEADREPLNGVASYVRVRVDGADFRAGPLTVPIGDQVAVLEGIPVGVGLVASVEGLGPEGNLVSRGRSAPFAVVPGPNHVSLFVGLTGTQGEFSPAPRPTNQARAYHSATLLDDGSLLLAGGTGEAWRPESFSQPLSALRSSEHLEASSLAIEPARSSCASAGSAGCMTSARIGHTATVLGSGNVLLAGGSNGVAAANSVELYQPDTRVFYRGPETQVPQLWHQAALCDRGVALLGGVDYVGGLVGTAQVYDQGAVRPAFPSLLTPRRAFTLTTLADGRLLAAGGFGDDGRPLHSTELLGRSGAAWNAGPSLTVARAHHTATVLADGTVLVAGGLSSGDQATSVIERFDPARGQWTTMDDGLKLARWGHTATLLTDGRVLVVGGFGGNRTGSPTPSVETVAVLGDAELHVLRLANLREGRAGHTATRVGSGLVVVAGGINGTAVLDSLEVFVY